MGRTALLAFTALGLATGARAAGADECSTELEWGQQPARLAGAAQSGDRTLVLLKDKTMVIGRDGTVLAQHGVIFQVQGAEFLGRDGGFWEILGGTIDRLDADGLVLGPSLRMPDATAQRTDAAGGVLAVGWSKAPDPSGAGNVRLTLVDSDGRIFAEQVVAGSQAVGFVVPIIQGDQVWLLWLEDPASRTFGMRFALDDGHPLDAAPIAIGSDFRTLQWAHAGAAIRVYPVPNQGPTRSIDLAADGTVTPRPFDGTPDFDELIGTAGGDVLHIDPTPRGSEDFPADSTIVVRREDATGAVAPLLEVPGVEARALADGDETVLLTVEDTASGDVGTSRLIARRLSAASAVVATIEVDRTEMSKVPTEFCTNDAEGCSAGGGSAAGALPLAAALLLLTSSRSRSRRSRR